MPTKRRMSIPRREQIELRDDKSNYLDKELEKEKRAEIYSTEKINQILKDIENGTAPDMIPFFHGKIEWRNADLAFEYTKEEWDEMQKCQDDPFYFIETYCKFLTDRGRVTVKLRDYQKDVIEMYTDSYYNEEYEMFLPKSRLNILLQSRQTGKCVSLNTNVTINNKQVPLYEIYYRSIKKPSILDFFIYTAHKFNKNNIMSGFIYKCMCRKFKTKDFQHFDKKIIQTTNIDTLVLSENNDYKPATHFHITKPFTVYIIKLENGFSLECADTHLVKTSADVWKYAKDLTTSDLLQVTTGFSRVISVTKTDRQEFMCDVSVNDYCHSYFTNGILSHNTTTTAAFMVYYMIFNKDKNARIVANKGDTAEEILDKVTDILKGLPFWLKPGVRSVSKTTIKFENGCTLKCSATSETPATGSTIHLLMVDECALIPANKIVPFWQSVWPTLSSSEISQIIVLSTPRGRHNLYADLLFSSDMVYSHDNPKWNGFRYKRVDYWQVPGHDTEEWKQKQIAAFGEANFNQEFGLSFDSDASKLVSPVDLKWMNDHACFFRSVDIYGIPRNVSSKLFWHPDFHPDQLTEQDLMTSRFFLQIDTAEGKQIGEKGQEDSDWNVITIYKIEFLDPQIIEANRDGYKEVKLKDCIAFRQVGVYMDQVFDEEECAEAAKHIVFTWLKNGQMTYLGTEFDNCRVNIEINFNGHNWLKIFKKHDMFYPSLVIKTFHSSKATKKEMGFKTVSGSKGKGYFCELGAKMISRRQIIITHDHEVSSNSTIQQLEAFAKSKTGTYSGGVMHDDLATTVLFVSVAFEEEEFQYWLDDWFMMLCSSELVSYEMKETLSQVNMFIEKYAVQTLDDEYSESDIAHLYGNAASGFGKITTSPSTGSMHQMPPAYPQTGRYPSAPMPSYPSSFPSAPRSPQMPGYGGGYPTASPLRQPMHYPTGR